MSYLKKMNKLFLIIYIPIISFIVVLCLPQQSKFRDKLTRRIFEIGMFAQYKSAIIFTKMLIWSLLVFSCLYFAGILFPI